MPWRERLYERPLRRPLDDKVRAGLDRAVAARRSQFPMITGADWHPSRPELTIRTPIVSFVVRFADGAARVDAEMTLAGKLLASDANRRLAIRFIEEIAVEVGL